MMLLTVGLSARKGTDILIRALPIVCEELANARLVIVSSGPRTQTPFKALAESLGVLNKIEFFHNVSPEKLSELYDACDVFILTPRYINHYFEGYGLVYLEAGLHKKPVIASRSGGVGEAVIDGETGLLVPEDDSVATARAIITILRDPALARRLGENGYVLARGRNWDTYCEKIVSIYTNVISKNTLS